jgi:hypothetical protein
MDPTSVDITKYTLLKSKIIRTEKRQPRAQIPPVRARSPIFLRAINDFALLNLGRSMEKYIS